MPRVRADVPSHGGLSLQCQQGQFSRYRSRPAIRGVQLELQRVAAEKQPTGRVVQHGMSVDLCRRFLQHDPRSDGSRAPGRELRFVGVTDCLRHGDNGLLTKAGDVAAHAQALADLIEIASLRRSIAMRGLADCRANYSWRVIGRQVIGVYERLRGTVPATTFKRDFAILPCRFREQPHLL